MIWLGDTQVLCTASVEDRVPPFLKNSGSGWVTAEYSMLPRATNTRQQREVSKGPSGRTMEIQRLIGRALRSVVETRNLGERTITIDCDVIQADGGTRTASITGAFVALYDALRWMQGKNMLRGGMPTFDAIAAVSVGIVDGRPMLDLAYEEDSRAAVDMNVVMTGSLKLVEVQGTAEGLPFSREQMNDLIDLAESGITHLLEEQKKVLGLK